MKFFKITPIALGIVLAWSALPAQAEVVGKVIALAGEATVERQGRAVALTLGAPVESGDLLKIGEPGNLQVRFNDEAIVALRSNSQLRVDQYVFANKPESDSSVMSLLKGGMRTITGLIGRFSRNNYSVNTSTSTIGIRGTHFTLVQCDNDCRNTDGSIAPNGTFGGVTGGRIAVANDAGEREFGKNEFFFVASRSALPDTLLAPPSFLRDRLEGQAKASGKSGTASGKEAPAKAAATADTATSTTPQPVADATTQQLPQTANVVSSEQPAVVQSTVNPFVGYANFAVAGVNFSRQDIFSVNTLLLPDPERSAKIASLQTIFPVALAMSSNTGYSEAAGQVHWGHWFDTDGAMGGYGEHWAVGNPTPLTSIPTSSIYTYAWVGGTRPTDNLGNIGTLTSTGGVSVDFTTRRLSSVAPLAWTVGGHAYSLSVSDITLGVAGSGTKNLSCDGCTSASVDVDGQFTGSTAQGIIAGIFTDATFAGGQTQQTASAQVYAANVPTPEPETPSSGGSSDSCASYPCTYASSDVSAHSARTTSSVAGQVPTTYSYSNAGAGMSEYTWNSAPAASGGTTDPGTSSSYTAGALQDVGSADVANLHWQRYSYTSTYSSADYSSETTGWDHYMSGDAVAALPSAGLYTYAWVGGTNPTDVYGNVGSITSGGSWTVNFADRSIATATPVNWSLNGIDYSLAVPAQTLQWTTGSYTDPAGTYATTYTSVTPITNFELSCGAGCVKDTQVGNDNQVAPWFFGANAEALGVGISTEVIVGTEHRNANHVQAYKR